jgi:hypothetical protein
MAARKKFQPIAFEHAAARRMRPRLARPDSQPGANDVAALQSQLASAFTTDGHSEPETERYAPVTRMAIIATSSLALWAMIIGGARLAGLFH